MNQKQLLKACLDDFYDQILNYMYLQTGSTEDAHDLTQDVFLRLVKSIDQFQGDASIRTFVFSIARHVFSDNLRKKYRMKKLLEKLKGNVKVTNQTFDQIENYETFLLLEECTPEEKQLLILKHYLGFNYEEISEITSLSASNVGVKLSRLKKSLKKKLEGSGIVNE